MQVSFATKKLEKEFGDVKLLRRRWGPAQAERMARRVAEIVAADHLAVLRTLPQLRAHELTGDRRGQISLDVCHPYRLLLVPDYDAPPRKPDGGLDWPQIAKVKVLGVENTHE